MTVDAILIRNERNLGVDVGVGVREDAGSGSGDIVDVATAAESWLRAIPASPPTPTADLVSGLREHLAWSSASGTEAIEAIRDLLRETRPGSVEHECIQRISLLEEIKAAAAAAQVRETVEFRVLRAESEAAQGIAESRRCRGLGDEIALARRESPTAGSRFLGLALMLSESLPHAMAALTEGRINEHTAGLVRREVETLPEPARFAVDGQLKDEYGAVSARELAARARGLAYQADPNTVLARFERAVSERRVTVRPAADGMAFLTALLPTTQAFACKKALMIAASTERSAGEMPFFYGTPDEQAAQQAAWRAENGDTVAGSSVDIVPRSAAQMEADILVTRLAGQTTATGIPVELTLLMTDEAALGMARAAVCAGLVRDGDYGGVTSWAGPGTGPGSESRGGAGDSAGSGDFAADPTQASAWVPGLGPLPAAIARDLLDPRHDTPGAERVASSHGGNVRGSGEDGASGTHDTRSAPAAGSRERVYLRRVLLDPITGDITAIDTRRRAFDGALRRALLIRDGVCQTPGCGAPIRHLDHTHPYASGGSTSMANGTGLCLRCNNTKEIPGWRHRRDSKTGTLTVTSPTGLRRTSRPPDIIPRL